MEQRDRLFIGILFIIVVFAILMNSFDLQKIASKVEELVLENQKPSVITPTPQKDVE